MIEWLDDLDQTVYAGSKYELFDIVTIWGLVNSVRLYFWAPKSLQMVIAAMKLKDAYSLEGKL